MADACLFRRLGQTQLMQGEENIPALRQVTRDPWGHVLNGMMDTVIESVASDTFVLTVEGHIQEQYVP